MPSTPKQADRREAVCLEIVKIMQNCGRSYDWKTFAQERGISRATIYRWVREIHESGVAAQARLRKERTKAKRQVREAAKLYGDTAAEMKRLEKLAEELPQVPSGRSSLGMDVAELGRRLEACATGADDLIHYATQAATRRACGSATIPTASS